VTASATAADPAGLPTPARRRHLARGMAAAAALSVAVHAAVLIASARSGSSSATGAPPAAALQTRLIALSSPAIVPAAPDPVAAPAPPTQETPPPAAEAPPRVPAVTPTLDRDSAVPRPQAPPPPSAPAPEPAAVVKPPSVTPASPPVVDANPVAAPPAPSVTYHGSTGLNPPPRPLSDIEQLVPEAAGARGGTVVLRMYINEQGGVDKAEVLQSSPPGLFDTTALEAASRARFSPGYLGGVPVKSQVTYEIRWGALGSGVETSGRTY